jgi:hypothetical protein
VSKNCRLPEDIYLHVLPHVAYLVVLTRVEKLQVTWQPYEIDEVEGMTLHAICTCDHDLWRAELPLICYYIVEWHLANHVVHQFGRLQIVVVQHEATSQNLHQLDLWSWSMCSMFYCKVVWLWHQLVVCFMHRVNRRKVKGPSDWTREQAPYIALWNARARSC